MYTVLFPPHWSASIPTQERRWRFFFPPSALPVTSSYPGRTADAHCWGTATLQRRSSQNNFCMLFIAQLIMYFKVTEGWKYGNMETTYILIYPSWSKDGDHCNWWQGVIPVLKLLWLPACLMYVWHPAHSITSSGKKKSICDWVWEEKDHCAALGSKSTQINGRLEGGFHAACCTHGVKTSSSPWDAEL